MKTMLAISTMNCREREKEGFDKNTLMPGSPFADLATGENVSHKVGRVPGIWMRLSVGVDHDLVCESAVTMFFTCVGMGSPQASSKVNQSLLNHALCQILLCL